MIVEHLSKPLFCLVAVDRRVRDRKVEHNRRILNHWHLRKLQETVRRPEFLGNLLKDFEEDSAEALEQLIKAVANKDTAEYRQVLHALIGAAREVGASSVEYTCQIAQDVACQDLDRKIIVDLEHAIQRAREALAVYLATFSGAT